MKFKETIKIIWGTNRWYRYLSASIILLFVVKMLMAVIGGISFINIIGVISLISNLLVVLWLASTVMMVYSSFHEETATVPVPSAPMVRRFLLSLFAVVAILLFLFIIVMLFGASART